MKVFIFCITLVAVVTAFKDGAPERLCTEASFTPSHGVEAKNTPSPYKVHVKDSAIKKGGNTSVTISGENEKQKIQFKGFLIAALDKDKMKIGTISPASYQVDFTRKRCSGAALTHSLEWVNQPWHEITVTFIAPADFTGKVTFMATVVQNMSIFWVDIPGSQEVTVSDSTDTSTASNNSTADSTSSPTIPTAVTKGPVAEKNITGAPEVKPSQENSTASNKTMDGTTPSKPSDAKNTNSTIPDGKVGPKGKSQPSSSYCIMQSASMVVFLALVTVLVR